MKPVLLPVARAADLGYPSVELIGKRPHPGVPDDGPPEVEALARHCGASLPALFNTAHTG